MNKQAVVSKFSHVKPGDIELRGVCATSSYPSRIDTCLHLSTPPPHPLPPLEHFKTVVPPAVDKVPPPTPWK